MCEHGRHGRRELTIQAHLCQSSKQQPVHHIFKCWLRQLRPPQGYLVFDRYQILFSNYFFFFNYSSSHNTKPSNFNTIYMKSSSKKSQTGVNFSVLTSPSVDSNCRSFRLLTLSGPLAALTSTPRGASIVSVLVGDSSLGGVNK